MKHWLAAGALALVGCVHLHCAETISHELSVMGGDATIRYTILDGADAGKIQFAMQRDSSQNSGWLAVAFGSGMVGAKVVRGAQGSVDALTLSSRTDNTAACGTALSNHSFSVIGKKMLLEFTASEICGEAFVLGGGEQEVIFAYDDSSTGTYSKHDSYDQVTVDWKLGLVTGGLNVFVLHGVLMILAFAVLFPVGMVPAVHRHRFTSSESYWFKLHRGLQGLAFLLAVVGTIVVVAGSDEHLGGTHQILGVVIVGVMVLQVLFVSVRHNESLRQVWYASHMLFAVVIVGGGLANCYLGTEALDGKAAAGTVDSITYTTFAGLGIGGIAAVFTVLGFAVRPPKSGEEEALSNKVNQGY